MSEIPSDEKEENHLITKQDEEDVEKLTGSDDEDDYEGYFLEPVGNSVNIVEKIAEANKKLLEELEGEDGNENRPRKVQFSEEVVNFEPNYYSDDDFTESAQNSVISEEDLEPKLVQDENKRKISEQITPACLEDTSDLKKVEEDIPEEIPEELVTDIISIPTDVIDELSEKNPEFILVLLPKEHNSSCESIIGEEILEKCPVEEKETKSESEKLVKTKIARPKSAKKSCEVSKISPNLGCSSNLERRSWQSRTNPLVRSKSRVGEAEKKEVSPTFVGEIKVQIKGKVLKKININDDNLRNVPIASTVKKCGSRRPRSCHDKGFNGGDENRPNTAPMSRTCYVIRTELPRYNGLRSEYGLSAEQLQERKQKGLENKQKKKQELIKKRQEEIKKRNQNEETFQKWLFNKTKKALKKKPARLTDTLTRSDVYIQTHASYAKNRSYCLNYNLHDKSKSRKKETHGKKNKTIIVEKYLENMTPHIKKSFNIYLGVKPQIV